ncbi:MAG: T9SS C-terminal target domain-containing protein [Porphyromonadaceae bacterium]|nr:MAG: T9SS C-terminal target domain-containing protein [Porphyromonadaceae bacterium]
MRKFTLLLALAGLFAAASAQAQTPGTKGNGQVFYSETFGWENPADDKGWTAATGYYFLDPTDTGFNFVWWPAGLGFVSLYTQDPPLNSTTKDNGCIANFIEAYNYMTGVMLDIGVDNSVGFPTFDCSQHSTVVVSFETHFMAYSVAHMWLEISVDDWVHSATYSTAFGAGHKDRPMDKPKGEPALFQANITDVAAGMPNVKMRLHWIDTRLYYWAFDDFKLSEAYNNDLKMNYVKMEWDDGNANTAMAWIHNIPKSQLDGTGGFLNFQSSTLNFGEYDQESVYLDVDVTKNGSSVFHKMSAPVDVSILTVDTADIADKYSPVDYGHYKIGWEFKAKEADDLPDDNKREVFFNVTDSVYSRSGNINNLSWSMSKEAYNTPATENLNHFIGSIFPIFNDCEVSSISTFITGGKADQYLNYRFTMFFVPIGQEDETPFELLTTEMIQLDSADFNTWVTMPLEKDGESEFLKKGDLVYAGIQFDNTNAEYLLRRNQGLEIGTDNSVTLTESASVAIYDGSIRTGVGDYFGKRNVMCRLNLNDHGNRIDGVDLNPALANLGQNFPNPFSRSTEIAYELTNGSEVSFEVMDLTGRKVMEVNKGMMPAGKHTFTLETNNLDPGVYFYTLKAGSFVQTKQMVIVE